MITLKLNLRQLNHALMTTPKGGKVMVIPIKENNLFEGEKGIYLDIVGFEFTDKTPDKQYPDTHLLKQSFSKDELAKLTEEQKKALPILGSARVGSAGARGEAAPADMNNGKVAEGLDDLPFEILKPRGRLTAGPLKTTTMEKLETKERDSMLIGITSQKEIVLGLITWVKDNYPMHPATNLLIQNLTGVYDQLQKIILSVATGEQVNEPSK